MSFQHKMKVAREQLKKQPPVVTQKTRITDYEYCKTIVDLAIVKLKERKELSGSLK